MPAAIPAIIALATAGTTVGMEVAGVGQPSMGAQQKLLSQQNQEQQAALTKQEQSAFQKFAPDVQAQTGGALAAPSFASMVAEMSGSPADVNLAQQTLFPTQQGLSA